MNDKKAKIGRIALREEGEFWNAYFADKDTMEGAQLMGSIRMSIVTRDPALKDAFMTLMRLSMEHVIEDTLGEKPTWGEPTVAPEHERTKG